MGANAVRLSYAIVEMGANAARLYYAIKGRACFTRMVTPFFYRTNIIRGPIKGTDVDVLRLTKALAEVAIAWGSASVRASRTAGSLSPWAKRRARG